MLLHISKMNFTNIIKQMRSQRETYKSNISGNLSREYLRKKYINVKEREETTR